MAGVENRVCGDCIFWRPNRHRRKEINPQDHLKGNRYCEDERVAVHSDEKCVTGLFLQKLKRYTTRRKH